MKLSIFAAIFMAFVSLNQVFGSMTHSVKSKEAIISADESLVKPIDAGQAQPEGCPVCARLGVLCPYHYRADS
ncbi:uncharacterized protein MELLADRAFT_124499 [Melampsora larici-populina 98AG31]|uniref:Candidate secreted effector protein MPL124499 n=1 Tax=Melampsora larici-populina (strain 98AG31 / pathotype 3-4-7) TaxID=747676 RepID=CSEPC_MELLP|nr:uncharacterized protein MELLADRAFT_124499 [Melampsora larici-populina 98AG31]F4RC55.1 RecName: Full=Candidate secreted effector protein MPL124499; Short=CSEP MPL124499; AltName: Full=Small secreted protein MPL124499; Short=SSP MPL124499; Flags: Precursor [Melampsora larici-populina 98AG31]EGG10221.1 secreted protein [Melampsora larici-populina 98AG31]